MSLMGGATGQGSRILNEVQEGASLGSGLQHSSGSPRQTSEGCQSPAADGESASTEAA